MIGDLFGGGARQEKVLRLLDQERGVILNGPLGDLAALVERREAMIEEVLTGESPGEAFLAEVKAKAERNSRLLLASLAGVRAAAETLGRARRAAGELRTYSADGRPVELGQAATTRDTRA
ncbi:MAG: hypothetical protein DI556_10530 [Rhodovulum sulfidophilum]|uniref:Flagellar protein FlgN n=1 Tax=Rhodovulum sulfidophilum TaxID=35806 RepID=A0A2W5N8U1_RHOSU|nr:MAG: hypothetical protein DI556_10530 [Rhodovulum sulfidophilum]